MAGVLSVSRALRERGATTLELHDPDPSRQAIAANSADADCFVNLRIYPDRSSCTTAFYRGFRYESVTSRSLAERLQRVLPSALDLDDGGTCGIALPILRETRMPAVELQLGDPSVVVQHLRELAQSVVDCLADWVEGSD
jgi:N-acetylmuramoyl-L-alanine amidase